MIYLDTSLVVAALTREVSSPGIQEWLHSQEAGSVYISDWVLAEFSAALSIKLRAGQINMTERAQILAAFSRLCTDSFEVEAVRRRHFRMAAHFTDQAELGLRSADALHVAICLDIGAALASLDRRQRDAAPVLGVHLARGLAA